MSLNETRIDIPAEHVSNIFGQFDHNIKLIERTLNVTVVPRNEGIKVIGDTANVEGACKVFAELLQLAERGNINERGSIATESAEAHQRQAAQGDIGGVSADLPPSSKD